MYLDPTTRPIIKTLFSEQDAAHARQLVMTAAKTRVPDRFHVSTKPAAANNNADPNAEAEVQAFDLHASLRQLTQEAVESLVPGAAASKTVVDVYEALPQSEIENFQVAVETTTVIQGEPKSAPQKGCDVLGFWAHQERRMPGMTSHSTLSWATSQLV